MDAQDPLLRRLDALEIKACEAEDLLDELNLTVYRQQRQIDALARQLEALRLQQPDPATAGSRNLRDELPPHY
ncbi:SlyX family protein [Pseudorhodoferax sp. Leaf274]|uniref:SlyX family protein n=1 Tax=Pseudorhodoferax sp. Leaf274 TaxID=1736318 RepID=UPI000702676C|nr:SlyX family protein [Pseudorhodoferax sp. Leaf274]KQP49478.1 SlyX protein [Pseudorhodoferax sp. Leaf274]